MSTIHDIPEPNYWGGCPVCRRNDGYYNLGREHWFVCHKHRVRWHVGENLFSSWRDLGQEEQAEMWRKVDPYRVVLAYEWPASAFAPKGQIPLGLDDAGDIPF